MDFTQPGRYLGSSPQVERVCGGCWWERATLCLWDGAGGVKRRSAALLSPALGHPDAFRGFGGIISGFQDISPKVKSLQLPRPPQRLLCPPCPGYRLSPDRVLAGAAPLVPIRWWGRWVYPPPGQVPPVLGQGCSSGGAQEARPAGPPTPFIGPSIKATRMLGGLGGVCAPPWH